jgi:hypothetical protein
MCLSVTGIFISGHKSFGNIGNWNNKDAFSKPEFYLI